MHEESVQQHTTYKTKHRFPEFEVPYMVLFLKQVNKPMNKQRF